MPALSPHVLPVRVAIGVLTAQALALIGFSAWLIIQRFNETPSNEEVFEGAAVYLALSGALVGLVALALRSGRGWAYGAAVVVQLIGLGVVYEMARAEFWVGAVPLAVAAVAVLWALLSKAGRAAFGRDEERVDRELGEPGGEAESPEGRGRDEPA